MQVGRVRLRGVRAVRKERTERRGEGAPQGMGPLRTDTRTHLRYDTHTHTHAHTHVPT